MVHIKPCFLMCCLLYPGIFLKHGKRKKTTLHFGSNVYIPEFYYCLTLCNAWGGPKWIQKVKKSSMEEIQMGSSLLCEQGYCLVHKCVSVKCWRVAYWCQTGQWLVLCLGSDNLGFWREWVLRYKLGWKLSPKLMEQMLWKGSWTDLYKGKQVLGWGTRALDVQVWLNHC